MSDWPMPALGVRCFVAEVTPERPPQEVADRLALDPRVESAQVQQMFELAGHGDPYYELQAGAQQLQLDALHRMATGRAVKVAQIDTGVDVRHPDLAGQISAERNFVDERRAVAEVHGTAVAGIIAAKADNGVGIVGVAPGARLLALRACWEPADNGGALCSSFTLAKAMQFALVQRAQVINLSLTGPHDRLLERLLDSAARDGITLVAALGPRPQAFPASHPAVIAVGASGSPGRYDGAVLAPGRDVLTTTPGGSWGFFSGASFAAAHVSGLAALMLERSSGLAPAELRALLTKNQTISPGTELPVLDACAALAQASHTRDCACCGRAAVRPNRNRANAPAS
jgi:subtilisin family serine protease